MKRIAKQNRIEFFQRQKNNDNKQHKNQSKEHWNSFPNPRLQLDLK
jgi:hypothetical protein